MASPSFLDLTASQVLDELAGPVAPGGGSALAFTVAMAAAVVRMDSPFNVTFPDFAAASRMLRRLIPRRRSLG